MAYSLEHVYDEASGYANFLIEMIGVAKSSEDMGKMCNDLAALYRTLGLCELLIEADTDTFFHHLIDSALTRKYYLVQCWRDQNDSDPQRRASINGPFLDAVVANQFKLAGDLVSLSPTDWLEGYEYEEDFVYAHFLHRLVAAPEEQQVLRDILARYETTLQGMSEARLGVCTALVNRDQRAFDVAFHALVDQFQVETDVARETAYRFDAHQLVFMEGLGLLQFSTLG